MKKVQKNVKIAVLVHCDWNPRTAEDLAPDHPEMVKLIASVRELGVVQPIAVWDRGKDGMIVIAGNRRFAAAQAAGMDEIQAVVFTDISEAQAREITRVENEVRLGIDPIKDAELIGDMIRLGYRQNEIAAHFGVCEAKICRRAKLLDLVPKIREAALGGAITADALERISCYPAEVQERLVKQVKCYAKVESPARWEQLKWHFQSETMDLDSADFCTNECVDCMYRTGAQADLWGEVDGDKLGRCMRKDCFERMVEHHVQEMVVDRVGEGVELVNAGKILDQYDFAECDWFADRKSKNRPVAWWYWDKWSKELVVRWGDTAEKFKKWSDAEKEFEEAKEREENSEYEKRRKLREEEEHLKEAEQIAAKRIGDLIRDKQLNEVAKVFGKAIGKIDGSVKSLVWIMVARWAEKVASDCNTRWSFDREEFCEVERLLKLAGDAPMGIAVEMFDDYEAAREAVDRFRGENGEEKDEDDED